MAELRRIQVLRGQLVCGPEPKPTLWDVVVIGAGFSGMYLLHQLRSSGLKVKVLEAGSGVGKILRDASLKLT